MPTDLRQERIIPLKLDIEEGSSSSSGFFQYLSSSWRQRGIANITVSTPTRSKFPSNISKSRWKTPEFIVYAIMFILVVPQMVRLPMQLSNVSHHNYPFFVRKLSRGWIFGRLVDNSDSQYRVVRNNLIPLSFAALVLFLTSRLYNRFRRISSTSSTNLHRIPFLACFSITVIIILHGFSTLKIATLLTLNYLIAKIHGSKNRSNKLVPALTWVFNLAILYLNEVYDGYRFASIHPSLKYMDEMCGVYPRWDVTFNITMLRLLSFNMDYHWALGSEYQPVDSSKLLSSKDRAKTPHDLELYNFTNYIVYVLYTPLFIGGPIMTFNDFIWQLRYSSLTEPETSRSAVLGYAIRFIFTLLTMEFILHYMYVVAIKDTKAWYGDSPMQLCMIGFWNLIIVWLKLLIFWRFSRLWALVDGINPPENMVRCMANNYSALGFWRGWHRSYNLWLTRYIYVPLGGSRQPIISTLLVFTFVALWHDLSFRLLAWGWLVSFFILPEILARWAFPFEKYGDFWWYRHLCAIGAVFNILLMMIANLVGFVLGIDGTKYMISQLVNTREDDMGNLSTQKFLHDQFMRLPEASTFNKDLTDKTVVITGATSGVGLEVAKHLTGLNPKKIILACRNLEKGQQVIKSLGIFCYVRAEVWLLDLTDFKTIISFAERFEREEEKLDLLIQNAGSWTKRYLTTVDGWEMILQTLYLGPVLLVLLLLPSLKKADAYIITPRIVLVGSESHYYVRKFPEGKESNILEKLNDKDYCIAKGK
ncbi:hypothetical protein Clacol_002372 [Clathrus columnatus]|uniref:Glycerol uptake protein 1 n=1 Tax=Clathrus columnatus TaxID=1419009 RepID=A0AAV5A4J0_9AGAM|nr:hypothetical protein Clacol_002372 [Clathrus columnatus]